jgi:hypothetical protein
MKIMQPLLREPFVVSDPDELQFSMVKAISRQQQYQGAPIDGTLRADIRTLHYQLRILITRVLSVFSCHRNQTFLESQFFKTIDSRTITESPMGGGKSPLRFDGRIQLAQQWRLAI